MVAGALCGGVIGYLKAQWVIAGSYFFLFLLWGGDSMKDMNGFFGSVIALYLAVVLFSGAIGGFAGYQIGKRIDSRPKLALAGLLFGALTLLVFLTHLSPPQAERRGVELKRAKFYDTDGYPKVAEAALRPRKDRSGWDLAVKIDGRRGGRYLLYCIMSQAYSVPGSASFGTTQLYYERVSLELPAGRYETAVAIPSGPVAAKFAENSRFFDKGPLGPTTLKVYLEAVLPQDAEYYGSQWQLIESKELNISLKDIGLVL